MKRTLIILAIVILFAGCSMGGGDDITDTSNEDIKLDAIENYSVTASYEPVITPTATPTLTPMPTSTPIPHQPKYIFIVIGDGMGQGGAFLGEVYARLESENMSVGAVWESFAVKNTIDAMCESACGGTALSTGYKTKPGAVGVTLDAEPLYTIMDRAKENGMSTGVITNSSLDDATPASFMVNFESRYNYSKIATEYINSNVDFMAGGGLIYFAHKSQENEMPEKDCYNIDLNYKGNADTIPGLEQADYNLYFGKEGAETMLMRLEDDEYPFEKAIYSMSALIMPWEIDKYQVRKQDRFDTVPTLAEMTEMCAKTLSQNPNGFVMMIEEAYIDKASHMKEKPREVYQVKLLNETMKTIMEFYNEHPYETLVILTADHETGHHTYNEELANQFKSLPDFQWFDDKYDLSTFLQEQWGFRDWQSYYYKQVENSKSEVWQSKNDARAQTLVDLTVTTAQIYGTKMISGSHSNKPVPLYVTGVGSDKFVDCVHTSEIPITICEMLGWDPLPEIIVENDN